jgi:hypothetical protein
MLKSTGSDESLSRICVFECTKISKNDLELENKTIANENIVERIFYAKVLIIMNLCRSTDCKRKINGRSD